MNCVPVCVCAAPAVTLNVVSISLCLYLCVYLYFMCASTCPYLSCLYICRHL